MNRQRNTRSIKATRNRETSKTNRQRKTRNIRRHANHNRPEILIDNRQPQSPPKADATRPQRIAGQLAKAWPAIRELRPSRTRLGACSVASLLPRIRLGPRPPLRLRRPRMRSGGGRRGGLLPPLLAPLVAGRGRRSSLASRFNSLPFQSYHSGKE